MFFIALSALLSEAIISDGAEVIVLPRRGRLSAARVVTENS